MNLSRKENVTRIFTISAIISIVIAIAGIFFQETYINLTNHVMTWLKQYCSGIYLWAELLFVVFVFVVALSPWGNIRLGKDTDTPEYSLVSWFAMLFAAGMGIGLVFWGVAEPLSHYIAPMGGIESASPEADAFAIRSCFMHWGLQPWVSYSIVGLGLAYFQFRKGQSALVSNLTQPLLGSDAPKTILGQLIDVLTTVVTVIGVASSFGMGCIQMSSGLHYLFGVPDNKIVWLVIIIVITAAFLISAIMGLDSGINSIQTLSIIMAFPYVFIMLLICLCLILAFRKEKAGTAKE